MDCPKCTGKVKMRVLETRTTSKGVERAQACPEGHRFRTVETIVAEVKQRTPAQYRPVNSVFALGDRYA